MTPSTELPKKNWFQQRYLAFIERQDKKLLEQLKQTNALEVRFTIPKLFAFLLALLIHGFTILLPLYGVYLIVTRIAGPYSICYGILFVLLAIAVRPRIPKMPEDIVTREKFPTLYEFVDQLAAELHAPPVDSIVINEFFNASFGRYGYHQSRLITIGYTFWMALTPQERIAMIGHEIAHSVNGDFARNLVVGSASGTLIEWYRLLHPRQLKGGIFALPTRLLMWGVASYVLLWHLILSQLLLFESRRAEYLADYLGATLGGSEAMIGAVRKVHERRYRIREIPTTTHPPLAYRIDHLNSKPSKASFTLQPEVMQRIDAEFATLDKLISDRIRRLRQAGRNYY